MTEQEIFEHLFTIADQSDDTGGVVSSCLVRQGNIVAEGISCNDGKHSEYVLLRQLKLSAIPVLPDDIIYTTVEPCGKRTLGGPGEHMGDCTTNLIQAGARHVVYAAPDPDASAQTRYKFEQAGCSLRQVNDPHIIRQATTLFNSTITSTSDALPQ
ncbi:cytidine/deoxycytidylate deaminase family protein [Nostoc sp.]